MKQIFDIIAALESNVTAPYICPPQFQQGTENIDKTERM